MENQDILILCDRIRQIAFDLHKYLRHGHLEKIYEKGLANRLRHAGFRVESQWPLQVRDEDGSVLGDFYADLFVENCLIIEIKACKQLANDHFAQVIGYLRASGQRHALLINFGASILEIRKIIL